jgi:hypothetical protein
MLKRRSKMKKMLLALVLMAILTAGCMRAADVASQNISNAADNFEINRRIVFYNGINGDYILVLEGLCSLGNYDVAGALSVTCKTGPNAFKKHFLGLSDNVTFFAEQIDSADADPYHYRVIFRPSIIIPDVEVDLP